MTGRTWENPQRSGLGTGVALTHQGTDVVVHREAGLVNILQGVAVALVVDGEHRIVEEGPGVAGGPPSGSVLIQGRWQPCEVTLQ